MRSGRTAVEVVAESNQPRGALMEFLAKALEDAGFELATTHWPQITVIVGGERHTVGVGGMDRRRLSSVERQLQEALRLLDA